ncbi:MAG: hypothetical protein HY927_15690 [Elusimicrobia bacterium]|nr:hypothetical protein [Elusimicrobiota bacterium]
MKRSLTLLAVMLLAGGAGAMDERTVLEKAKASHDEVEGKLTLFFRDALTGLPIAGAKVRFEGDSEKTDKDGSVTFAFPDLPEDGDARLVAEFHKKGYIESKVPLLFRLGMIFEYHHSISPSLPPGSLRVVVDWGKEPRDLDAHLVKKDGYHISYRDMRQVEEVARLDRDDTDGEGPETITVDKVDPKGVYAFYVHDYTNREAQDSGALASSHAHVSVFGDEKLMRTLEVPSGKGRYWTVFFLREGSVVPAPALADEPAKDPPPVADSRPPDEE